MKARMTIQEAARRLGVKDDALRKRLQRGSLEHDKDPDGRAYVYLDATHDMSQDTWRESSRYATQDAIQDAIQDASYVPLLRLCRSKLSTSAASFRPATKSLRPGNEELLRKDHIIARLTERILAIEAPPEPRESPETSSEATGNGGERAPQCSGAPARTLVAI
jgi:excisionase family DNA binding protein